MAAETACKDSILFEKVFPPESRVEVKTLASGSVIVVVYGVTSKRKT